MLALIIETHHNVLLLLETECDFLESFPHTKQTPLGAFFVGGEGCYCFAAAVVFVFVFGCAGAGSGAGTGTGRSASARSSSVI